MKMPKRVCIIGQRCATERSTNRPDRSCFRLNKIHVKFWYLRLEPQIGKFMMSGLLFGAKLMCQNVFRYQSNIKENQFCFKK